MEALPLLVLESVCEYLAYDELRAANLWAFASTSRTCRAAARRERFRQISFQVDDAQQYDQELVRLERMLEEGEGRGCVRILKIAGHAADQIVCVDDEAEGAYCASSLSLNGFRGSHPRPNWNPRVEPRPDGEWNLLARFISSLHLKDLVWASTEQVPRCVLSVLEQKTPLCRLHVHVFDLRSLHQRDELHDIDEAEYMLAKSPCLHSIIAPYSMHDATGRANYNGEATLEMVASLTPDLKHVRMWDNTLRASGEIWSRRTNDRLAWRGFHPRSSSGACEVAGTKGQLQSLRIDSAFAVTESHITTWAASTDFSFLRTLKLANHIVLGVLQALAGLAEGNAFCHLTALDLPVILADYEDRPEVETAMLRLLLSLPPLARLEFVGGKQSSFDAALEHHGLRLQTYNVKDVILSTQQIRCIRESCPKLIELSIEILRTAGDRTEVEIYQALGAMQNLERLTLGLHCTAYRHPDGPDDPVLSMGPSSDHEEEAAVAIAMREVFINAALDESLARSIFQEITTAHASTKLGLRPMLTQIRLWVGSVPALHGQSMNQDFQGILDWIGRSWTCKRDPRDTHQSEFHIEEFGSDGRKDRGKTLEDEMKELSYSEQYGDIWRALWPETGRGWKEEWQAFPLEVLPA